MEKLKNLDELINEEHLINYYKNRLEYEENVFTDENEKILKLICIYNIKKSRLFYRFL